MPRRYSEQGVNMEDDDFLAAVEADNEGVPVVEAPVAEAPQEPTPQEPEQPAEPALELTELAPEQPKPTEGFVPLGAVLDERDRRKAAEAELERFRQAQQAQPQPVQMPDPYEDPEGFAAAQEARVQQALYAQKLVFSEQMASVKHGEDVVKEAKDWGFKRCDTDPYFNAKVAASPDPIGFVVAEYRREEIASKVSLDEFAQFQAWKTAQAQLQQQTAPAAPPTAAPSLPPRSLASAPSAGTILTEPVQSDDEIFDEVIGKR